MTVHYRTQAFVFKKSDLNEADRNFSVFTDSFGRLEIFGKAIRKDVSKLRSGIDTFFLSDIEFIQGKKRKTLTDATKIEKFNNIVQLPARFLIAQKIAGVLDNFIKGEEKDDRMFNLINEAFAQLNNPPLKQKSYVLLYYYFLWNAFAILGYCPEIQKCNVCCCGLNPYSTYFSYRSGGIICKKCLCHDTSAKKINSDIVKILRLILKKDWQVVSKLKIGVASQKLFKEVSDNYYVYLLSSHSFKNSIQINQ